ncbi:MAG TPA: phospholipase [Hydrogenophaga sp.]|uniref:patatin-like phospholipase family protein n=1 Tax=Hydrogenophaga sp. TaxID=1904254 RepID=UPI002B9F7E32|nr:patatin-like phospholipase family protein [Hydrogenophaga sp.]HMN91764.1 phospholipase [Hydrogenophaga sp.]HMP10085.1 phospholipase [Hydrogenophaga sp.]
MGTPALRLYAGPIARRHIEQHGLRPQDVGTIPAAAGGPKGLILGPLDRFIFGDWLVASQQPVHLVGASIGAWRMATACLDRACDAFERLERDYIAQHHPPPPGKKRPAPEAISEVFAGNLRAFYSGRIAEVLNHPRYRLHVVTSRGRHLLHREGAVRTPLGYLGAFAANALHRRALGAWLERVVFSSADAANGQAWHLPFAVQDFPTRQVVLREDNFMDALQASCSIPFVLKPVHGIAGAPPGSYWDGGITDYHLHLHYQPPPTSPIVLYPHFQRAVVPGWLDKPWRSRHRASPALDAMLVLAPDLNWVQTLPGGKLPDRNDFTRFAHDPQTRMRHWNTAVGAARQLADEFAAWLESPDPGRVEPL